MTRYDDILHMPHPVSQKRPRMSVHDRAAQFAPFAALTGYDAVLDETARLTQPPVFLTDSAIEELDRVLRLVYSRLEQHPAVEIIFFCPDRRKTGGKQVSLTGIVKKLDPVGQLLLLENGVQVPLQAILQLQLLEEGQ